MALAHSSPPDTHRACCGYRGKYSLTKLLSKGSFYIAAHTLPADGNPAGLPSPTHPGGKFYDFTCRWQQQSNGRPDPRFFWNRRLWREMEKRGVPCERWVMVCIRGSVEMRTIYVGTLQVQIRDKPKNNNKKQQHLSILTIV